jgi:hypothetical protein
MPMRIDAIPHIPMMQLMNRKGRRCPTVKTEQRRKLRHSSSEPIPAKSLLVAKLPIFVFQVSYTCDLIKTFADELTTQQ